MSTVTGELLVALHGPKGQLDAWLELNSEGEIRDAILAIAQPTESPRDRFASAALSGICAGDIGSFMEKATGKEPVPELIARTSYRIADAMLAAREVKP